MIDPRDYIGRSFEIGAVDCYSLLRDFYKDAFNIHLKNYARPRDYHIMKYSMYEKYAKEQGFEPFTGSYHDVRYGDVFGMNIDAEFINHVGIYIGQGEMLHHYWGRLSEICMFSGIWMSRMMRIARHIKLKDVKHDIEKLDILEVIPEHVKHRINASRKVPIDWTRADWRDQLERDGDGTQEHLPHPGGGVHDES